MNYSRRVLPNPKRGEELPWIMIEVPDGFFNFDKTIERKTPAEQWMYEHIGWRAWSLDRLRYNDYFDWYVCVEQFIDLNHSRYRIHFRDPQHAVLFKLKWDPKDFMRKIG